MKQVYKDAFIRPVTFCNTKILEKNKWLTWGEWLNKIALYVHNGIPL